MKRPGRKNKKMQYRLPNGRIDRLGAGRKRKFTPRRKALLSKMLDEQEYIDIFQPWAEELIYAKQMSAFFEIFFGEEYRRIRTYKVEDQFILNKSIPFVNKKVVWKPSENPRRLDPGELVLLRTDIREPHIFEIQVLRDFLTDKSDERIFKLGPREFYEYRKYMRLIDDEEEIPFLFGRGRHRNRESN